jgi:predicted alpha-1,2-mannosidase
MKKHINIWLGILFIVLVGFSLFNTSPVVKAAFEVRSLIGYVDPKIGVQNGGSCVIGPQVPFGSINPSPDTPNGGTDGYDPASNIRGFSQTHVSGTGGNSKYGNFLISAQTGLNISEIGHDSAKANEVAAAGYYGVDLTKYGIRAEVTATSHSAIYCFTCPSSTETNIIIDLGHYIPSDILGSSGGPQGGDVYIDNANNKITGWGSYSGGWDGTAYNIYFSAKFSKTSTGYGTFKDGTITQGSTSSNGGEIGGFFKYSTTAGEKIYVKIAISMVSIAKADQFLTGEIPAFDFAATRTACESAWNNALSAILIDDDAASSDKKKIFYTSLYHAMIMPRNRTGDCPWGSTASYYDDHYCGWDTFRSQFPLMVLIRESEARGIINSYITRHAHDGYVCDAFIAGHNAIAQGGNSPDNDIADAYVKGVSGVDWNAAYAVSKWHADNKRSASYRSGDRGWVPHGTIDDQPTTSCSKSVEYTYNDFCVAQVANGLGLTADYTKYVNRSKQWENLWNSGLSSDGYNGFIQPKDSNNAWISYDPKTWTGWGGPYFYEGTGWEYSYHLAHDFARLIQLMGGATTFVSRTQHLFDAGLSSIWNEPGFLPTRTFNYALRPDLTSDYARRAIAGWTTTQYPGDEDSGAMGSFYVWSALGFFPNAGQDVYLINGPLFQKITIQMENGNNIVITGTNASDTNKYIQSATLNGASFDRNWFRHSEIKNGANLVFTMGSSASTWGRSSVPPSLSTGGTPTPTPTSGPTATPAPTPTPGPTSTPTLTPTASPTPVPGSNIALNKTATANQFVTGEDPPKAVDGISTYPSKWCSNVSGDKWLKLDLGQNYTINRWVVKHCGAGGEPVNWNTSDFKLQKSSDGNTWTDVDSVVGNTANITDRNVTAFTNRYVRLYITKPTSDTDIAARIYEFELYSSSGPTSTPTPTPSPGSTATPTPSPTPATNKILNGEFDNGTTSWTLYNFNTGGSTMAAVTGAGLSGTYALKNTITNGGTLDWHVQIMQLFPLTSGKSYKITFKAKADAGKTIKVVFQQNYSPYSQYYNQAVNVTTSAADYGTFTYNCTTTDANVNFMFFTGGNNSAVYIDKVVVTE